MFDKILNAEASYVVVAFVILAGIKQAGWIDSAQFDAMFQLFLGYAALTLTGQAARKGVAMAVKKNGGPK